MLDSIRMATVASSVHGMQPPVDRSVNPEDHVLQKSSEEEERFGFVMAFHLGTAAGGKALGLDTGVFERGMKWDALKVELMGDEERERLPMMKEMDWRDLVERWICQGGGERGIREVWVDGKLVMERR
jgi:cytosine/adenosine deaminase-related metal-dependent hydrolase